MGLILIPGTCRVCGCTDDNACVVPPSGASDDGGDRCSWVDDDRTLCSFCALRDPLFDEFGHG